MVDEATPVSEPSQAAEHASKGLIEGKAFREYVEVFKIPLFAVIAWSLLSLALTIALGASFLAQFGWVGIVVFSIALLCCGWFAVKKHGFSLIQAALAGLIGGLTAGAISGLVAVVQTFFMAGQAASAAGSTGAMFAATALQMTTPVLMVVAAIVSIVAGLFFGALLALVGAFAASHLK